MEIHAKTFIAGLNAAVMIALWGTEIARIRKSCRRCERISHPCLPIPRSMAGPGLQVSVLTSKFDDHVPFHRQNETSGRMGTDTPGIRSQASTAMKRNCQAICSEH